MAWSQRRLHLHIDLLARHRRWRRDNFGHRGARRFGAAGEEVFGLGDLQQRVRAWGYEQQTVAIWVVKNVWACILTGLLKTATSKYVKTTLDLKAKMMKQLEFPLNQSVAVSHHRNIWPLHKSTCLDTHHMGMGQNHQHDTHIPLVIIFSWVNDLWWIWVCTSSVHVFWHMYIYSMDLYLLFSCVTIPYLFTSVTCKPVQPLFATSEDKTPINFDPYPIRVASMDIGVWPLQSFWASAYGQDVRNQIYSKNTCGFLIGYKANCIWAIAQVWTLEKLEYIYIYTYVYVRMICNES